MIEHFFVEPGSQRRFGQKAPGGSPVSNMGADSPPPAAETGALIRCAGLRKRHVQGGWLSRNRRQVEALRGVDLTIRAGSTLALIGPSGSGKSTLARCLACLERPDSGEIWFAEHNLTALSERKLIPFRRQIQLIFQDPGASLNPRFTAEEVVSEPLVVSNRGTKKQRRERVLELIELVGLAGNSVDRLSSEFSGGQRRRLAIARALALDPKIIILDEALAGLDLSIQAQISNLLLTLQEARSLTYLCISHDLDWVAQLTDDVAVLHAGEIVESGTSGVLGNPQSSQTRELLDAALELSNFPR